MGTPGGPAVLPGMRDCYFCCTSVGGHMSTPPPPLASPPFPLTTTVPQVSRMQRRLAQVWHRFAYAAGGMIQREINGTIGRNFNEVPENRCGGGQGPGW